MQTWAVQDAKARFSEFLERCLTEGPQMVTKRGAEAAVLVPADEWRRLQASARPSLKELLMSDQARADLRKPEPHGAVVQWMHDVSDAELHISAVTIGEIQSGIELTREQDESKAAELEHWLELVSGSFNVIPMDGAALRMWARLMHRASDTLYEDAMIAATAKVHKFVVVTRNVADFKGFGVKVLNPFVSARK